MISSVNKRAFLFTFVSLCVLMCASTSIFAQDNVGDLFLRKAVKQYVARQYDAAINDLDQSLLADPANLKARKLLAKCWERKASELAASKDFDAAKESYRMALQNDSTNADAKNGIMRIETARAAQTSQTEKMRIQQEPAPSPLTYSGQPQQSQQAPIIITPQAPQVDSMQAKIIAGLLSNFQRQQEIMAQQLASSGELLKNTDAQKEKYLEALIKSSDQKSGMMREFILIGAAVVIAIVIIALFVFIFIFGKYSKASELRTIQATEAVQALLANNSNKQLPQSEQQLLISGPSGTSGDGTQPQASYPENATIKDAVTGVTVEALSVADASLRAKAVESMENELQNGGVANPAFAPKIAKLRELLTDANNRVRANAAKAYYLIDPEQSLRNFAEMLCCESSRSRASALWALGEIGSSSTLEMILSKDEETDEIVRYNIRMALQKIVFRKTVPLDEQTKERIEQRIAAYADAA